MPSFEIKSFRKLFPLLQKRVNGQEITYFDNGATTQKPKSVIQKEHDYYCESNSNVHRASFSLAAKATSDFENVRFNVASFINANSVKEIIWSKGTTESINLVANSWGRKNLCLNDEIILSMAEHHANIVPWQQIASETGAKIRWVNITNEGIVDLNHLALLLNNNTKLVAINHVSNVLGKENPITEIIQLSHSFEALVLIDGAQAAASIPIDVQKLNVDFYVFSAHKMYGPTGVGVLYGKERLLNDMPVYQSGGEMIKEVTIDGTTFNELPFKFEAGTPNIAGVIAFGEAINFINQFNLTSDLSFKNSLTDYTYNQLRTIDGLKFLANSPPDLPIFSFTLPEHNNDIASYLDSYGIALRSGSLCAMPLMKYFDISGCIRLSLAPYNTFEEVDFVVDHIKRAISQSNKTIAQDEPTSDELHVVSQKDNSEILIKRFSMLKGWDSKHREIMLLGKSMPRMDKEKRNAQTLIEGCESQAWLKISIDQNGFYQLEGDSDAKVIRGLMSIVFSAFNNKTAEQIHLFNIDDYFKVLGLEQHLSPSRGNGLKAIVKKIKSLN